MQNNALKNIMQKDVWLSEMLKINAYRIRAEEVPAPDFDISGVIAGALSVRPLFAYAKVPVSSTSGINFLGDLGFRIVDTNVVFEKPLSAPNRLLGSCEIRFARAGDANDVSALAGSAFKYSRFHLDRDFDAKIANTIKSEWAANFFKGKRGTAMVVALADGRIVGFLQLIQDDKGVLTIDLIGVDSGQRRKGIAKDMIGYAQNNLRDVKTVRVGTQIANTASIRCYEGLGFKFADAAYVLHYHNK